MTNSERSAKYLRDIADMLEQKGKAYGNSVGQPIRVFSQLDSEQGLRVRIDDKISRLVRGKPDDNEDTIKDLIGYLALLATVKEPEQESNKVKIWSAWKAKPETKEGNWRV